MELAFSAEDEAFRTSVREWLAANLTGEFKAAGSIGGSGREHEGHEIRHEWEKVLGANGWTCLGWPKQFGGRGATLNQQVIFNEEYVRAGGPNRISFFGEELLGPTLIAYGTPAQQQRFLPGILRAEELWCQGFSEPDAGSDLANVKTTAVRDGDEWVINGQKVWTSLGHIADWIFVVCRTDPDAPKKHQGISFLLCPVDQPGVEMRPIQQITGTAEFNEVFFTDARTDADLVVGEVDQGWRVVMGTLGFERGTAFLGEQMRFTRELAALIDLARERGLTGDPVVRQRLAEAYTGLEIMRMNGLRSMSKVLEGGSPGPEASIGKLQWSTWHQRLGELMMDLMGPEGQVLSGGRTGDFQYTFLWSRAETIFAGSSEIQRNIIAERVLGLPR